MKEIRFHGRGGQGAVTSAELAAQAAIFHGLYAQAFPSFGPERRGAPVAAFLRISEKPIRLRSKIYEPDFIVILDPSLLKSPSSLMGLKNDGMLIVNTELKEEDLRRLFPNYKVAYVDALRIAMEELGVPITNTTMLGALLKASNLFPIEALEQPVRERFKRGAESNIKAYMRAYEETKIIAS